MAESNQTLSLKEFQLHEKDTGSADVQVALLTRRIEHLTEHLKTYRKDHSSRRGLLKMVAQRRSLLDYLSKTKADRYKKLIDKLNSNEIFFMPWSEDNSQRTFLLGDTGIEAVNKEIGDTGAIRIRADYRIGTCS